MRYPTEILPGKKFQKPRFPPPKKNFRIAKMKSIWIVFIWIFLFLWMNNLNNSKIHSPLPEKNFEKMAPGL